MLRRTCAGNFSPHAAVSVAEESMFRSDRRSLLSLVAAATLLAATLIPAATTASSPAANSVNNASPQAAAALEAGRALLRRNRADEALPQLESALALYTRAGDSLGAAA